MVCALLILYLIYKLIEKYSFELIHIRNILLLIRWNDFSFFPGLYESFEKSKPLAYKLNYIEYRNYGESKDMNLVITVQRKDTSFKIVMNDYADLIGRFNNFSITYKSVNREKIEPNINKYVDRDDKELTGEEEMMKDFFIDLIRNDSDRTNKLAQDYKKIIGADSNRLISIKSIKDLLVKDKVIEALDECLLLAPHREQNSIRGLKREYLHIEKDYIKGIVTSDKSRTLKNVLVNRFLKFLDIIEDKNTTGNKA